MNKFLSISVALFALVLCKPLNAENKVYNPSVGKGYYILTPKVSDVPRINGAEIFGVRPGSPFLYTVSVTGKRPMAITASNLPKGLKIDTKTGIITGTITDKSRKSYNVVVTAKNSKGKNQRNLKIIVGEDICLTPPMGWSSWICFKKNVNQEGILRNAEALKALHLDEYGYNYVNIDDAWQGNVRAGKFNAIQPDKVKFPDIKSLSDKVHSMGFKFGIYSTPWISSYAGYIGGSSNNKNGDWDKSMLLDFKKKSIEGSASKIGKYRFDDNDAKQWAVWGVDYMKYDWNPNDSASIVNMANALRKCGRDIAFSVSNSCPISQADNCSKYVQVVRTGGDIRARWIKDREHLNLRENWDNHNNWLEKGFAGSKGHIPDADFLMIGLQKYGSNDSLSADELYHHVSSYILWGTPLLLSNELSEMNEFELSLLTNVEMLDINQDPLVKSGRLVYCKDGIEILVKELSNGDKAIGIFNFNDQEKVANVDWSVVGLKGKQLLRDVWRQKNIGNYDKQFAANVRTHGCVVLRAHSL